MKRALVAAGADNVAVTADPDVVSKADRIVLPGVGAFAGGDVSIAVDRIDAFGNGSSGIVVGTGEFVWRPFLLAERLERAGADVHFSSTTRSPIAIGHSIDHALSFSDNYGLGIVNFLYNVAPGQFDRVLLCTETDARAVPASLVEALGAEVIVDGQ